MALFLFGWKCLLVTSNAVFAVRMLPPFDVNAAIWTNASFSNNLSLSSQGSASRSTLTVVNTKTIRDNVLRMFLIALELIYPIGTCLTRFKLTANQFDEIKERCVTAIIFFRIM